LRSELARRVRVARVPGIQIVAGVERGDLGELALERRVQNRGEDGVRFSLKVNQAF
jgi:hypothetical protein